MLLAHSYLYPIIWLARARMKIKATGRETYGHADIYNDVGTNKPVSVVGCLFVHRFYGQLDGPVDQERLAIHKADEAQSWNDDN